MGINNFTLPVADEVTLFIALRSTDDAGVRAKEAIGHRKRDCSINSVQRNINYLNKKHYYK